MKLKKEALYYLMKRAFEYEGGLSFLGLIILWIIAISYLVMTWTEQHENL